MFKPTVESCNVYMIQPIQHLRTLKAMGCEPSGQFITSALELKFDDNTMFEWQKYNQVSPSVPHYSSLLIFLGLCAQVTETWKGWSHSHQVTSFITGVEEACPVCSTASTHPLYACHQFKTLPHDLMINTVNTNGSAQTASRLDRSSSVSHHNVVGVRSSTTLSSMWK